MVGNIVLIYIEVLNAQIDYNIFLVQSYMYAMTTVTYYVFRVMTFPHDDQIITINNLRYYNKKAMTTLDFMLLYRDNYITSDTVYRIQPKPVQ